MQCCFSRKLTVAYLNLGTSLIALGRCQEAAAVLRDGSKLEGVGLRDRTAHNNARVSTLLQLGGLYAEQGKLQRALAVYREALHNLPDTYPPQVRFSSTKANKNYRCRDIHEQCFIYCPMELSDNLSSAW